MPDQPLLIIMDEAPGRPYNLYHQLSEAAMGQDTPAEATPIDEATLQAVPAGFYPTTEDDVEWTLEQINNARDTIKRIKANSASRLKFQQRRLDFFLSAFTEPLRAYAQIHRPKKGRGQSVPLDNGTLAFRQEGAKIKISEDDAEAVALAERLAPDLIVTIPAYRKVDRTLLAKRLAIVEVGETDPLYTFERFRAVDVTTGEKIEHDALTIVPPEETFSIK